MPSHDQLPFTENASSTERSSSWDDDPVVPAFADTSPRKRNTPRTRADPIRSRDGGRNTSRRDSSRQGSNERERIEQSFGIESGRYRHDDGQFAEGSPPSDYNQRARRFQSQDGQFKSRSADLGADTEWDQPEDDAENTFDGGLFDY